MMTQEQVAACIRNGILRVHVKPGARRSELLKIEAGVVHLAIAAPPEKGKANAEVERFLTRLLKRRARIRSGFSSKEKRVAIETPK